MIFPNQAIATCLLLLMSSVRAQNVWASVYTSSNCATSTLSSAHAIPGNTCVPYTANGFQVSMRFQCAGSSEDSDWTADVFFSGDCSGVAIAALAGSDACSCQGKNMYGYEFGISASCTGMAPVTCGIVTVAPTATPGVSFPPTSSSEAGVPVWGAVYSTTDCDAATFLADGIADLDAGGCLGANLQGTDVSLDFTCSGLTAESSWTAGVYLTTDCSGFKVLTLSAADACTCGGLSVMGYSVGAYVNCGGVEPSCEDGGGEPGGGGGGTKSSGQGSSSALGSEDLMVVLLVGLGLLFVVLVLGFVYKWKCQNKNDHMNLDDIDIKLGMDEQPMHRL